MKKIPELSIRINEKFVNFHLAEGGGLSALVDILPPIPCPSPLMGRDWVLNIKGQKFPKKKILYFCLL